ncbi:glycoside hydrolase family 15 protein [Pseudolysinimonas sp.]|uniref:glycoside hydrolase family 15 protein n=1 Tax=Pseudolysinimonas sp. TaxID=2680009 RepID=UPI00286A103E|nr:glycoside hydrolase family 15 protein [Pseudolysinimonas sp.]
MPLAIEDYALIGDCHTAALVGTDGSIDWLCLPRFDSPSTFAGLLGDDEHGHWRVRPVGADRCTDRRYDGDSFTLLTRWVTESGEIEVVDLMPMGGRRADVIRRVRGVRGTVRVEEVLRIRFDYADAIPWVRQSRSEGGTGEREHALIAVAGPDSVVVRGPRLAAENFAHRAVFEVAAGQTVDLVLTWFPAHRPPPPMPDVDACLTETRAWWTRWAQHLAGDGRYAAAVRRSLLVLRALTHEDTAGIVAAPTTSLPESFGGDRNWDYRYVWLRDASLTLQALMLHGFVGEAEEWRNWLLRAIAGDPADVQIMYGLGGERRLPEWEVATLPGYLGSAPVRVGNGAYTQFQGDVFGEIMLALEQARLLGVGEDRVSWPLQIALLGHIEANLERDDHGIWEIRGTPRRFTQSRAMVWAAFDCGIRAVREHVLSGPVDRWERIRDDLRREIEEHGFNVELGSYVQYYGGTEVDASLLTLPQIGFVDADDPRMLGTVTAIERDLLRDGLLLRYRVESGVDGLQGDEHPFLACSFWLVQQYARSGRLTDAHRLMDRLVGLANDVGLLSEEYDTEHRRHVGNTPQAFSHLALVRAADAITRATVLTDTGPLRLEDPAT